jgi:hypothetical protein
MMTLEAAYVAPTPLHQSGEAEQTFDALRLLGILLLQNRMPSRAAIVFDVLCDFFDKDQQICLSYAYALLRSGEPAAALTVLDSVFPTPDDPALAWLLRGQALSQVGRPLEAARALRMFIHHRQMSAHRS